MAKEQDETADASIKEDKRRFRLLPGSWRRQMSKSTKIKDKVLIFYLNMQGVWEMPRLEPVISGDIVVIKHRAHRLEPQHVTQIGKYRAYVVREIDTQVVKVGAVAKKEYFTKPISNADFKKVYEKGRSTVNHPTIIKAVLAAKEENKVKVGGKGMWIAVGIIALIVIALLLFGGGK